MIHNFKTYYFRVRDFINKLFRTEPDPSNDGICIYISENGFQLKPLERSLFNPKDHFVYWNSVHKILAYGFDGYLSYHCVLCFIEKNEYVTKVYDNWDNWNTLYDTILTQFPNFDESKINKIYAGISKPVVCWISS